MVCSAIRSLTELDLRFSTHNRNREATRQTKFAEVRRCPGCFYRMSCVAGNCEKNGWIIIDLLCGGWPDKKVLLAAIRIQLESIIGDAIFFEQYLVNVLE